MIKEEKNLNNLSENERNEADFVNSKMEDYNKQVTERTEKGSKKRKIIAVIFVLANLLAIGLTVLLEFNRDGEKYPLSDVLSTWSANYQYVIFAFACTIVYLLLDGLKYAFMLRRITGKPKFALSMKIATIGRYYDNITPLAIGGQPFQVYYLHKAKVPAGAATAMPIASFFFTQLSLVLLSIAVFIFNAGVITDEAMRWTAYVGAFFSIFVPFLVVFFSIFPKTAWKITNACLNLLGKLRIFKDMTAVRKKVRSFVFEYARSLQMIAKTRFAVPVVFILSMMMTIAYNAIPYFVLKACGQEPDFVTVVSMCLVVNCAISFVPTPGNSGAAEGVFFIVFASLSGGFLAWGTILWRVASYYSIIIIGVIVLLISSIRAKRYASVEPVVDSSDAITSPPEQDNSADEKNA